MSSAILFDLSQSSESSLDLHLSISPAELSKLKLASLGDVVTLILMSEERGILLPRYSYLGCFGLFLTDVVAWSCGRNFGGHNFLWIIESGDEFIVEGTIK